MIRTITLVAAALLLLAAPSAAKTKPKPWAWTTAVAARQLATVEPFGNQHRGTLEVSRCVGKGKQIARRYLAFACPAMWKPQSITGTPAKVTVFMKVRPVANGQPCVGLKSLAAIPRACLAKGPRTPGDADDATNALAKKLGEIQGTDFPYQGPVECATLGVGYFGCWYGANGEPTDSGMGLATVVLASQPVVKITREIQAA